MAMLLNPSKLSLSLHHTPTFTVVSILNNALSEWHNKQRLIDEKEGHNIPICAAYLRGQCIKGQSCINRHSRGEKDSFVCKHWLRGLCKKSELCEFLHE